MTMILYPTRGGDPTYYNQDRVIALAQERGADILLLYVSSVRFLDHFAAKVPLELIETELDQMGEFMLAMAQERAQASGVRAEIAIRHGDFRQAMQDIVEEHPITTVVLGRPARKTALTTTELIRELAQGLVEGTQLEVLVLHDGEIVERFPTPEGSSEED